jgi:hypothetical protein
VMGFSGAPDQARGLSGSGGYSCPVTMLASYLLVLARGPDLARVVALGCCTGPRWRVVAGNISAEVTARDCRT